MRLKFCLLLTLIAGIGSPAWAQGQQSLVIRSDLLLEDPVNTALAMQSYHDMWQFLGESDVTWIRTSAALHFMGESDPDMRTQGEQLASEILASEPSDTHTLWLLLNVCDAAPEIPGCSSADIGARLIQSAPDNAAVYLKAVGIGVGLTVDNVQDSEETRLALLRASRANRIDIYYGHNALELYRVLEVFENETQPTHEPAIDMAPHIRSFSNAWTVSAMQPMMTFSGLMGICEAQVHERRADYVEACLTLSKTMQETGKALITRAAGYDVERRVMDAMGMDKAAYLYLFRRARMSTQVSVCQQPSWMNSAETWLELDVTEAIGYLSDLETVGEVAAIRNAATRGFEKNPEDFEQDPLACEALMDLDSESMGVVLGNADPKHTMEAK